MKEKAMTQTSKTASEGKAYLTKRILVRAASAAIRKASREAMLKMGYVVYVEGGHLVRMSKDGTKEILEELPRVERPSKIVLG